MFEVLPLSARLCDACEDHSSQAIRHMPLQELPTLGSLHNHITQLGGLCCSLSRVHGLEKNLILRREVTSSPMPQERKWEKGPHICEKVSRTGGDLSKREKWGHFTGGNAGAGFWMVTRSFPGTNLRWISLYESPQTAQHRCMPNTANGCFSFLQL